jgi:hypothetical protein
MWRKSRGFMGPWGFPKGNDLHSWRKSIARWTFSVDSLPTSKKRAGIQVGVLTHGNPHDAGQSESPHDFKRRSRPRWPVNGESC